MDLTISVKAGEWIYRQGDAAGPLFLVEDGLVELLVGQGAEERRVALLGRGEPFGERGALDERPRAGSARAAQDTRLIRIEREELSALVRQSPELALLLLGRLAARLSKLEQDVAEMAATPRQAPAMATVPMTATAPERPATPAPQAAVTPTPVSAPAPEQPPAAAPEIRQPAPAKARPRVLLVHAAGDEVVLAPARDSVIGRADPNAGIVPEVDVSALPNVPAAERKSVSRRHARIRPKPDGFYLSEEAGVANGTFVNKRRLTPGEPVRLSDGDEVAFGRAVFVFRLG